MALLLKSCSFLLVMATFDEIFLFKNYLSRMTEGAKNYMLMEFNKGNCGVSKKIGSGNQKYHMVKHAQDL